jgi:hypothetical protein
LKIDGSTPPSSEDVLEELERVVDVRMGHIRIAIPDIFSTSSLLSMLSGNMPLMSMAID